MQVDTPSTTTTASSLGNSAAVQLTPLSSAVESESDPDPAPSAAFPKFYNFPPFFTRQPNETTWAAQRSIWISFILAYCRERRLWRLNISDALETELFWNKALNRRLKMKDALGILDFMAEEGNVDYESPAKAVAIVYWKRPEEWANAIYSWVDSTGQKGSVLTLYELSEGDLVVSEDFRGIDSQILRKSLDILVKRGTAQLFGSGDDLGVKFF